MDRRMPCLQQRFGVLGKSIRVVRSSAISSRIRASPTRKGPFPVASPDDFGTCAQSRIAMRSEEHTSELQSRLHLVCRLLLEKKKKKVKKKSYTSKKKVIQRIK